MKYTPLLSMSRSPRRTLEDSGKKRRSGMDEGYRGRREKPLSLFRGRDKDQGKSTCCVCVGVGCCEGEKGRKISFVYV